MIRPPPRSPLFPYTTLSRSIAAGRTVVEEDGAWRDPLTRQPVRVPPGDEEKVSINNRLRRTRSEEHTSELQSRLHLVCRLLLEKKKNRRARRTAPTPISTAA